MPGKGYYDYEERMKSMKWGELSIEFNLLKSGKRDTQTIALELLACENFDRADELIDELGDR